MPNVCSFLQSICRWVTAVTMGVVHVTKKMYRSSAMIAAGTVILAVVAFTASGFSGGGRNALTAYAETFSEDGETGEDEETEYGLRETAQVTEAKIQFRFIDPQSLREGQILAGDTLVKEVRTRREVREERKEAVEQAKEEIRQIEEERKRLAEEESRRSSATVRYSDQDYELLKKIVQAEAGGCDTKGRILVANVVLNRVKSDEFPDTITGVVYQKSQFSPVSDGRLYTCKVSQETVEAVNRALAGEDYSQGALYFMNRRRSGSRNVSWFDSRLTYLFRHENHEFFR